MALDFSKIVSVRLGADPEFFLTHGRQKQPIPAYLSGITGTKENPQPLPSGGAVQVDGMALEFNIKPAATPDQFNKNIEDALRDIRRLVPKDFDFSFQSSATFNKQDFKDTPDIYKELGCEPDYDTMTMAAKQPPDGAGDKPYRTAGGHVHVSWTSGMDVTDSRSVYDGSKLITAYERYFNEFNKDPDKKRRRLYGSVGSFRPKEYGCEWRSPSNWWLNWANAERGAMFQLIQSLTYYLIAQSWYDNLGVQNSTMCLEYQNFNFCHSAMRAKLIAAGYV